MTPAQLLTAFCRLIYPDARADVLLDNMILAPAPATKGCAQSAHGFRRAYEETGVPPNISFRTMRRLVGNWQWTCRHCGHVNRGTDSSLFCESCGTPRG